MYYVLASLMDGARGSDHLAVHVRILCELSNIILSTDCTLLLILFEVTNTVILFTPIAEERRP